MAMIKRFKDKNGKEYYPLTSPDAVRDSSGESLTVKLLKKNPKLVPGSNIDIEDNDDGTQTISSAGGGAVSSVNEKTGDVVLTAEDVGALPDTVEVPTKITDLQNDSDFIGAYILTYKGTVDITALRAAVSAGKSVFMKVDGSDIYYPLASYSDGGSNIYSYTFSSIKNNVCTSYTMSKSSFFPSPIWTTVTQTLYELPSNGIPASDLASAVQTALGKAHEHDNKDVLDAITAEYKSNLDTIIQDYADASSALDALGEAI